MRAYQNAAAVSANFTAREAEAAGAPDGEMVSLVNALLESVKRPSLPKGQLGPTN